MKSFLVLLLVLMFFSLHVSTASAVLVVINKDGEAIWNVLSFQDELLANEEVEDFSIRKISQINRIGNDIINVKDIDGKVKLSVGSGDDLQEVDISGFDDSIIEIEERPAIQNLIIGRSGNFFTIKQGATWVNTTLPIQVNPKTARLSLTTSSGESFLHIMPRDAIRSVLRSKVITAVRSGESVELKESDERLVYRIPGEKIIPILNLYNYSFNVDSYVSAQTGELVTVDAPTWYKIFGFLVTQQV